MRVRRVDGLSRIAFRALCAPVVLLCLTALAGGLLGGWGKGLDLFNLTPKMSSLDGYLMVPWYALERSHHALKVGRVSSGAAARVVGYMMSGPKPIADGQPIAHFVLLPDAGSVLHPAHRFGDQMIDVIMRPGDSVRFSEGSMV